ncbi:autophagy- protein 2 [Tilletia horrida]|nr:autophagy- protein 2 [Tilletia horrida]
MFAWLAEAATLPLGVGTTAGIASLSTAIQRRILGYLLRRFLGHLLLDPDSHFDDASLDAALLATGRVEVRNLAIDPDAINALLLPAQPAMAGNEAQSQPGADTAAAAPEQPHDGPPAPFVPIRVIRGSISRVAIQLPWPNMWSGELSVEVDGPDVAFTLQRGDRSDGSGALSRDEHNDDDNDDAGMAGSMMFQSVLQEVQNEPEIAAALRGAERVSATSASSSSGLRATPAFAAPALPPHKKASSPATSSSMLQGIVDSLLARLKVGVQNARITVLPPQSTSRVPPCQLCLDSVALSISPKTEDSDAEDDDSRPKEIVRSASLRGVSLWLLGQDGALAEHTRSDPSSSSSDISSSSSSEQSSDSGGPRFHKDGSQRFVYLPAVELLLRQIPTVSSPLSKRPSGQPALVAQTEVKIPTIRLSLSRSTVVGLQILADDFTQWANSLPSSSNATDSKDGDEHEQEGLSSSSSQSTELGASLILDAAHATRSNMPAMDMTQSLVGLPAPPPLLQLGKKKKRPAVSKLTVQIEEAILDANVPRKFDEHRSRHFRIQAGQIEATIHPRPEEKRTSIDVRLGGLDVEEVAESGHTWQILQRTPPKSLFAPRNPVLKLHLVSFADPATNYRESKMALILDEFIASLRADPTVLEDILAFVAAPEGTFTEVEPNEITRISVRIPAASISIVPSGAASAGRPSGAGAGAGGSAGHGRMVLTLADVHARIKVMPRAESTPIHLSWKELCVMILDQVPVGEEGGGRSYGLSPILTVKNFVSDTVLHKSAKPDVELSVSRGNVNAMLCADTLNATIAFGQAVAADLAAQPPTTKQEEKSGDDLTESQTSTATSRNTEILRSVEEDAFDQAPTISSIPDLLEDDIPYDPSYVGTQTESPKLQEIDLSGSDFFGEGAIAAVPVEPVYDGTVVSVAEGVTIRMLHPGGINPQLDYFVSPVAKHEADSGYSSNLRVRCSRLNITLGLYAGYDWAVTRRALEEEARRVRRRLQKIKQLLSEGQEPDDSVEQAIGSLSESVHLTLPEGADELNATNALEALRQEFGDDLESEAAFRDESAETGSTASTWQAMPTAAAKAQARSRMAHSDAVRRRTKLERSAQSMIDININGISVEFDAFDEEEPLSSRLSVDAKKLEIIDNIKTSTWRTFLTELLPEGRTTHRDANARMLRLLVENERTAAREQGYEAKMRLKVAPLRLHVDQDALDFFKAFFAFKLPGTPSAPAGPAPASEPHIQVADVHAVRIKLDYKPKRVDYGELRQGKTIELMNFFHFDGSDMTLRHVTLRGIAGWPRFFEALNDIWTPDVKANQLADVIAGIAPIRTVVNVGAGLADLVLLPIEQYQKDGRLVKGIGRGLGSFAKTATLEAVKLTAQLATGTQVILERAEHVLGGRMSTDVRAEALASASAASSSSAGMGGETSAATTSGARPIPRPRISDERIDPVSRGLGAETADEVAPLSKYSRPPEDMRDALTQAYAGLRRGVNSAAQTILAVPMEIYEGPSGQGAAQPVIRAVPIAFLQGALGASEAVSKTLLGLQNAIDPSKDSEGKYK